MHDALHTLLLAVIGSTLLLGSCGLLGNGDKVEAQADSTYFRATLNGKEAWSGEQLRAVFTDKDEPGLTVAADTVHQEHYPYTERLAFGINFTGEGIYSLVNGTEERISYTTADGDVLLSRYHPIDDTSAHQLTITSYDSTGMVEGTFQTTVIVDSADRESEPGEPSRRRPDTLRFTDGEFRVKVEDRRDE